MLRRVKEIAATLVLGISISAHIAAPVLLPVTVTGIVATQTSCDKNRIREAAKASDRMATLIGSAVDLKRQLGQTGQITPEEELRLTNHLLTANTKVKQFNEFARQQTEDTPQTRLDLAAAFNAVTNAIDKLSNEAIFPIKNEESKKKLLAILNSINASIQIIDSALKG